MTAAPGLGAIVCMLCPGDLRTGRAGGIGTCIAHLRAEMPRIDPSLRIEQYDTRGPGSLAAAPLYFLSALGQVGRHVLAGQPTILHAHMAPRGSSVRKLLAILLAAPLRIPTVVHLHGSGYDQWYRSLPRPARAALRWAFRRAGRTIALSEGWRRFLLEEIGLPADRVDVIPNGVPDPKVAGCPEQRTAHFVFLGHLSRRKGVSTLLAALASPGLAGLDWRATLAGYGDSEPYREEARRLGIAGRVEFPGWLDRAGTDSLLASASALVLPSHAENLPMVVLEALAARVPVVATPVGALPEFLADGVSALLVQPGEAGELAAALERVIREPELRGRLAAEGRQVFERHFDVAAMTRRVTETYARLLGHGG